MKKKGKQILKSTKKCAPVLWGKFSAPRIPLILYALLISQFVLAQSPKVSLKVEKSGIEQILKEINKQTGYNYLLNHEQIPKDISITVDIKNLTIEKALDECLKNLSLGYEIKNKVIIIKPKHAKANTTETNALYQTIRGRIVDRESKFSLPGANVIILNSSPLIGSVTDQNGNFKLEKVPIGRHSLKTSYIGYEELIVPEILVGSAKEVVLNLQMTESASELKEVIVRPYSKGEAKNDMATVSARSFSVEESQRYAGSVGDPGRMALSFAGVNTDDDASNQIVIRGNSPNSMLWQLEGVQIPIPNHFVMEGWDAGYVSLLNTKILGPSDFYTGAFPAEYGNSTSGVFDLTFRNGNNQKCENTFEFGMLGVDLTTEGPFSKNYNGSYLINYRYSTFALMNLIGVRIGGDLLPEYTDLSYKFYLPTNKAGTFSIWGLGGHAYVGDIPEKDSTLWDSMPYLRNGYETKTNMAATGITHTFFPDKKSYFKTIISFAGNNSIDKGFELNDDYRNENNYSEILSSSALRFSSSYNRKITSNLTARAGFIYSKLFYKYKSNTFREMADTSFWIEDLNSSGKSENIQAYFQTKYRVFKNLTINAGVHSMYFKLTNEHTLEPRAGFRLSMRNNQSINGGFGVHSKHDYLMTYFTIFKDENGNVEYRNRDLKLQKSMHYVLGYSKMFGSDIKLLIETYYQHLWNLPVSPDSSKTWTSLDGNTGQFEFVSEGKGRNYGIEFTLEKYFTNNYYFLLTSTLYSAKYKPLDGNWYNSRYNNSYLIKALGGKEFNLQNNNILGTNMRFIWTGGRRITPIDRSKVGAEDYDILDHKRTNEKMLSPYLRLDIGVSYKINNAKLAHVLSLDIQNTTNRQNVGGGFYDYYTLDLIEYTLQGIIPVFSYKIEF
ncbi:MAG: carboxypeptidase-like regulatory domain-containing protein [Bacteroidales bacterium]|nr:carboxypeptidase-like regulatory domain-containing protein [Bacteroidales bacterium]MBN2818579.1 carboxypeptidase-like regulatory domain-containing protein [Bacteroidales bacterium]